MQVRNLLIFLAFATAQASAQETSSSKVKTQNNTIESFRYGKEKRDKGFGLTLNSRAAGCDGVPVTDANCCTSITPCDVGHGDCDLDSDCKGNLRCGIDNCLNDFSSTGSNWSSMADCCISIKISNTIDRY